MYICKDVHVLCNAWGVYTDSSILLQPLYVANAGGVIAMRLTHAGEDGFMLYIPSEVRQIWQPYLKMKL